MSDMTPAQLNEFLTTAFHQLKTPIGVMKLSGEMLASGDCGPLPPSAQEMVERTVKNNNRLGRLVEDLRQILKLNQHTLANQVIDVELQTVLSEVLLALKDQAAEHQVTLSVIASPTVTINADPQWLREAIRRVTENAIVYSNAGGTVAFEVIQDKKDGTQLCITNEGFGISAEEQAKLFTPFFRGERARQVEAEGWGLSLFLVQLYVELWGGRVWYDTATSVPAKPTQDTVKTRFCLGWPA